MITRARVFRVIDSCRTTDQVMVARTYAHLWLKQFEPWYQPIVGMGITDYLICKYNLLLLEKGSDGASPAEV